MNVSTHPNKNDLARAAASAIADSARRAIAVRGHFTLALSGGSTPWIMLEILADVDLDWNAVHIYQVDERGAADGDEARNWTKLETSFLDRVGIPPSNRHAMPVTHESAETGAKDYSRALAANAGDPITLDLVQLGLGDDGHTASLIPGDPVLEVRDQAVAWSQDYKGHKRMTLTYPTIDRAREILWLVAGDDKKSAVKQVIAQDRNIPGGRIAQDQATLYLDEAAAAEINS